MAVFGLTPGDVAADYRIEIYPDCLESFRLFSQLSTQWRCGPAGFYGLDYNILYHKLDRMQLDAEQYAEIESDIRTMESAALEEMSRSD